MLGREEQGRQTCRLVVADGENWGNGFVDQAKTVRAVAGAGAVDSSAANVSGVLPDDLGEVTISVERGIVVNVGWCGFAVQASEVGHLAVVEELSNDGGNVVSWASCGNVLTVSSATIGTEKMLARTE